MKKINLPLLALLLLPIFTGCGKEEVQVAAETPPAKVIQVETLRVVPQDLVEEFSLPGSLEAWQDLVLAAEVSGPVEQVLAEEGARIKKGQELVRIDSMTLQANLDSALSAHELQAKTAARLKELRQEQLVSAQEYDNAVSALDMAAASLRNARIMLAKGRLESPLNGLLEKRFVEPGEYVGVGDPLVRVVRIDRLKINVDVPEKDVSFLRAGERVRIDGSSVGGWSYGQLEGEITHVGYVGAQLTRTYPVRIGIDNPDGALRPGMIVRVRFVRRMLDQVMVIPLYAVVERDGEKVIFVRDGEHARLQPVRLGATLSGQVVIEAGLKPGDEVIVKGQQLLQDGVRIEGGGNS